MEKEQQIEPLRCHSYGSEGFGYSLFKFSSSDLCLEGSIPLIHLSVGNLQQS